ncbi:hypothetical protein ACLKA6_007024 [Drosophila palustris]
MVHNLNLSQELKATNLLDSNCNVHQPEELRQLAAILLRRLFKSEFVEFFKKHRKQNIVYMHSAENTKEEAVHIYGYLCDLLEIDHPVILGTINCSLPRIVSLIADTFCSNLLDARAPTGNRKTHVSSTSSPVTKFLTLAPTENFPLRRQLVAKYRSRNS